MAGTPFSIETWAADMNAAVQQIRELGLETLRIHRQVSKHASEQAEQWHLAQRLEAEHAGLERIFKNVNAIIKAKEHCRQNLHDFAESDSGLYQSMNDCAQMIEDKLPDLESDFATLRHSALDLLLWTQREAHIEDSELPDQYRASYAKLIAYEPVLKARMDALQAELLARNQGNAVHPEIQRLISALSRYKAMAESARGFIKSIVNPPMELEFHDTDTFHEDWQAYSPEERGTLATEFNDVCQLLLYDSAEFHRRVEQLRPHVGEGMDASLYVLMVDDKTKVIFTVDEDPVFEQITITVLRVVEKDQFQEASDQVIRALYNHLQQEKE